MKGVQCERSKPDNQSQFFSSPQKLKLSCFSATCFSAAQSKNKIQFGNLFVVDWHTFWVVDARSAPSKKTRTHTFDRKIQDTDRKQNYWTKQNEQNWKHVEILQETAERLACPRDTWVSKNSIQFALGAVGRSTARVFLETPFDLNSV